MSDAITPPSTRWSAEDAQSATGAAVIGGSEWTASGVSIDTRTLKPGDLFVALTDQRDGHDFVGDAMARGAAAALVSRGDCGPGPKLLVPDTLEALRQLGQAARARCGAVRVAVTGSVGKTSLKEALAAVFRAQGRAHWSVKSYNNHWGVPLTLARLPEQTRRAVFELGMNHAGEISALTRQVRPHIALITRIGPAHLENLGSIEAIADAKGEIFEGLEVDGIACLPADDPFYDQLASHVKKANAAFLLDFGRREGSAVRILDFETGPEGSTGRMEVLGARLRFSIAASGEHWAWNTAGIFAAGVASGLDASDIAEALADVRPEGGRGRAMKISLPGGGSFTLLDDSYNANPVSMAAAISTLGAALPGEDGRRIAVLGDMLELGPQAEALHAELAAPLVEAGVDRVQTCGSLIKALNDALPDRLKAGYALDQDEALDQLKSEIRPGDVVLIKGSNASGLHKIAAKLADGSAFLVTER